MRKELLQARPKLGRPLLKETPINDSNSISRGFWWVKMPLGPMQPMQAPQLSGIHELHVCKSLQKLSNLEFANHHLLWSSISITTRLNSPKNDRKEDPVVPSLWSQTPPVLHLFQMPGDPRLFRHSGNYWATKWGWKWVTSERGWLVKLFLVRCRDMMWYDSNY